MKVQVSAKNKLLPDAIILALFGEHIVQYIVILAINKSILSLKCVWR